VSATSAGEEKFMKMGQSITIKGELTGAEDLTLEGRVEGRISLPEHVLTVGAGAHINAEVVAKTVVVLGTVVGNVTATEKFELRAGGSMQGNLKAPRISMADGAIFGGKVEMPQIKAASGPRPVEAPAAVAV
jgi:cytoskeletal protein CcmA (bactofilin family)